MTRKAVSIAVLLSVFLAAHAFGADPMQDLLLGQEPPGLNPKGFAPGLVSLPDSRERSLALSPDADELFFTRGSGWPHSKIMHMKKLDGAWSEPRVAFFSEDHWATEAAFSPDGKHLYFSSSRGKSDMRHYSLWRITRAEAGWSEPESLFEIGGGAIMEFHPTLTRDGSLYFCYWDFPRQTGDIYVARLVDGRYAEPVVVGHPISTEYSDVNPFVDPDERYLLFASDRPGGYGKADIYVSFKNGDGAWSTPRNLGPTVNTPGNDDVGDISPDGKYWFYTVDGDIYWMDAQAVALDPGHPAPDSGSTGR